MFTNFVSWTIYNGVNGQFGYKLATRWGDLHPFDQFLSLRLELWVWGCGDVDQGLDVLVERRSFKVEESCDIRGQILKSLQPQHTRGKLNLLLERFQLNTDRVADKREQGEEMEQSKIEIFDSKVCLIF